MSDQITYEDKVDLQVATNIANINKVTASDMNEIKSVVNGNADEVGDITTLTTTDKTSVVDAVNELNAPEKWVSVGTTAPTDGRKVWFKTIDNSIVVNNQEWFSKPKVLWTNPNPTSNFASQTITLNDSLANYSYYEILYKTYKDENIGYNTGKIPTNWGTNINGMVNANDGGVRSRMRSVTINSSTQIEISSCSLINTKGDAYTFPNDDRLIPFKILGYKE